MISRWRNEAGGVDAPISEPDEHLSGSDSARLRAVAGGSSQEFPGTDMPSVQSTITAKLQQDPAIDYIITLGAPIALTAVQAVETAGGNARIATFDTNAELVDAIKAGKVQWAVDQQPFLQGYLAVDSLWLYLNNRNTIGGGQPVLTGPAFIDKLNSSYATVSAQARLYRTSLPWSPSRWSPSRWNLSPSSPSPWSPSPWSPSPWSPNPLSGCFQTGPDW